MYRRRRIAMYEWCSRQIVTVERGAGMPVISSHKLKPMVVWRSRMIRLVILLCMASVHVACGMQGDLYLPEQGQTGNENSDNENK